MPNARLRDVCEQTIEDLVDPDETEYVEGMVKLALFSRFRRRRVWARNAINVAFNGDYVELLTERERGVVYAFLEFPAHGLVVLVDVYREDLKLTEPRPSKREISQWPTYNSQD